MNSQPNPEAKSRRSRFEDGAIDATIPLRNRGDTLSWEGLTVIEGKRT